MTICGFRKNVCCSVPFQEISTETSCDWKCPCASAYFFVCSCLARAVACCARSARLWKAKASGLSRMHGSASFLKLGACAPTISMREKMFLISSSSHGAHVTGLARAPLIIPKGYSLARLPSAAPGSSGSSTLSSYICRMRRRSRLTSMCSSIVSCTKKSGLPSSRLTSSPTELDFSRATFFFKVSQLHVAT